jgi:hypothetical protein
VIGHVKDDHRMRCNYLKGRDGDRINAVLAAAGYNFSLLLRWLEELLCVLLAIFEKRLSRQLRAGCLSAAVSGYVGGIERDVISAPPRARTPLTLRQKH